MTFEGSGTVRELEPCSEWQRNHVGAVAAEVGHEREGIDLDERGHLLRSWKVTVRDHHMVVSEQLEVVDGGLYGSIEAEPRFP